MNKKVFAHKILYILEKQNAKVSKMINLLSQNELCYSIFSIKLDDHTQFSNLRPELQQIIPKGKFPLLNFKKYANDYKNGIDFFILLKKYSYSFYFDTKFLDELSHPENKSVSETLTAPDYIVLIVLHSFITWYINFIQNHSTSDIVILLRCLLIIMNIKNCKVVTKNRIYAASAFMNMYSEIVESTYITNITDIFPPIVEFLTMNTDLPPLTFDLLLKLGNRVIDPTSSKFTKDMYHFVNFVVIIIRTCGPRCPSYMTSAIVSLMRNSLIGLDKDALQFFGRSIQTLGIDTAFSIISELPDSILEKIIQNPNPVFPCKYIRNDNGFVFPSSEVIFENKLVTFSTFETDIRHLIKVPPYFPDLLSPNDLILPELLDVFDLIYDIVAKLPELKENLIKKACSIICSCSLSPHFYDIHSAFLYFLLILTKNSPLKKFPKDIFLSNLFRPNETIFEHDEDFKKINTIRHLAFLLLINQTPDTIYNCFLTIKLKPYTFSEFIYRFLPDMNNLPKILDISVPVFEGIMSAIVFYQKFQNISEDIKPVTCEARLAGFTFIDIMLRIPDFRKKFFESSLCVDALISLVFEKTVRNWALLKIADAFYLQNTSFVYLIKSCLNMFHITCEFGFSKQEIQQVEALIRFLDNEVFNAAKKSDLLKCFEPVISNICCWLAGLIRNASKPTETKVTNSRPAPQKRTNSKSSVTIQQISSDSTSSNQEVSPSHSPSVHRVRRRVSKQSTESSADSSKRESSSPSTPKPKRTNDLIDNLNEKKTPHTPQPKRTHRANSSMNIHDEEKELKDSYSKDLPTFQPFHRHIKQNPDLSQNQDAKSAPHSPAKASHRRAVSSASSSSNSNSNSNFDLNMLNQAPAHAHGYVRPNLKKKSNLEADWNPKTNANQNNLKDKLNSEPATNPNQDANLIPKPKFIQNKEKEDSNQDINWNPNQSKLKDKSYSEPSLNFNQESSQKLKNAQKEEDSNTHSHEQINLIQKQKANNQKSILKASSNSNSNSESSTKNSNEQLEKNSSEQSSNKKVNLNQAQASSSVPSSPMRPKNRQTTQTSANVNSNEVIDLTPKSSPPTPQIHSHSEAILDPNHPVNVQSSSHLPSNARAYFAHLLNKLLNILTRFSTVHTISQSDISVIDTTASFLYGTDPSEEFFKRLIFLIAGDFLPTTNPSFDIKQPKAMKLVINLFNKSKKLLSKINYIVDLCKYSTTNCEQLQKGEFDLFLVGRLILLRDDKQIKAEVFTGALLILRLISARSCSVSFVHQYVSMFCPIDCQTIPRFHQEILDSMQTLIQNSGKVPATPLPIFTTTKVTATNVQVTSSFTVFFWFFIYSNKEPVTIVEINNESRKFIIQFIEEKISIFYQQKPEQWNGELDFDLPINQWSFATFSVLADKKKNQVVVKPAINGNIISITIFPYFDFSQNLSQVNVGITDCDKLCVLLGSFGITRYFDPSVNISLCDAGPRRIPSNPYFFFLAHDKNDNFEIEVIPQSVKATIQTVRSLHRPSFTDILIEICGVSILVPILGNVNLTASNGKRLPYLLEQFIEILEMSLTLSYNSQRIFASEKSFLIISNILLSSKHVELSYRAFLRFCSLFESLENKKCRSQLLFGILLKFDLWIRCDSTNLKRILRYLDDSLIPLNLSFVMKKVRFNDIIASLRIFFWYEAIETDIILHIKDRRLHQREDIRTCREHLLSIALMMASEGLTSDEFKFLISQILSIKDREQLSDLLHLVNDLIDEHEKVAQNDESVMESLVYLAFLYSTDLEIIELTLNVIIKACHCSYIKEVTMVNHFEIMMHELPSNYAYFPVLEKLLEICKLREPKLFSLCSMIAFSLGSTSIKALLDTLIPNVLYCSTPYWPLWPVVSLYKINNAEVENRLIKFLISISPQQWKNIFWTIDNVGRALKVDQELLKKKFLVEIGEYLLKMDKIDEMSMRLYLSLVPQFLFLRPYFQHNAYLKAMYSKYFKKRRISNTNSPRKNEINESKIDKLESESSDIYKPVPRKKPPMIKGTESKIKKARMSQMTYGKRSSFRLFDSFQLTTSQEKFTDLEFIKFKITDLISLFKEVAEKTNYKLYFGLRINEENVWEDIDIARTANKLFAKFPNDIYYKSCLFINAFMLHYDRENAIQTVNKLKVSNEQNIPYEFSLFNKQADKLHCQKINDEQPSSYYQKSYQFLQNYENRYHENKTLIDICNHLDSNDEKAKKLYFNFEIDISQISTEIIADFKENLSLRNTKYSKFWTHFWRAMTIGRAPWRLSLSEDQKKKDIYFRRDFVLCASLCPFRMRPNYQFDSHKKAAQKRDEGLHNGSSKSEVRKLTKSGTLISLLSSSNSLNQTRSLFSISNANLLESTTEFGMDQSQIFNATDQIDSSSENIATPVSENSKCIFESTCEIVTPTHQYEALFSLQKECVVITKSAHTAKVIKNNSITAVFQRTLLHRETAIEIFLDDGISYFVNFPDVKSSEIIKQFKVLKKSSPKPFFLQIQQPKQLAAFSKCTTLWQNKKISNFDYLMILNIFSGRSFNNPSQYPLMPWIIKDYESSKFDLSNPDFFRDLSKPAGALGTEKLDQIKKSMESLPYLYSSGNVSPLIVFLWLVRVEPFTSMQIKEQDGQFDAPDRQFKSIAESFNSVLTLSSDFRELIPEFFFLPEFLVNMNKFDLGVSKGKKVDNVELPKWINTDSKSPIVAAYEFVYLNRKALESDHVSAHLNEWIDLIWGDKSRGEKAVESDNVYCPEMYPEIWESESEVNLTDDIPTIEAILSYVGQIPKQLFDKPHPIRNANIDKAVLPNLLAFEIKNQNKIKIGKIIFLPDLKTVVLLSIDENGTCIENDVDINDIIKEKFDQTKEETSTSVKTPQSQAAPVSFPIVLQKEKIRRTSSQKFITFLNLNESEGKIPNSRNSTDLSQVRYSTIEKGNSHFDPTTFDQTIWTPAFSSPTISSSSSLFDSYYGFNSSNQGPNSSLNNGNASISLWKKFFIVDSYQKSDLYLVDPKNGQSDRVVRQTNDITAISTDGCKWLAVANKDSKIYLYSLEGPNKVNMNNNSNTSLTGRKYLLKVQFSIPSFRDFVKCCCISTTFHTLVCGTRDNSLMICSMTSHSIIKIVDLDAKPIQLLITPSWGFIVAYMRSLSEGQSTHYLAVLGTNGYLIRKVEIENSVRKMATWRDENGFDFVLFADSKNRIFSFEAFYCNIGKPIFEASSNVTDLAYMESHHAFVALCENGTVYFVPSSFN